MIEVESHVVYVMTDIASDKFYVDKGYPMNKDGSIADEEDLYQTAYSR